MNRAINVAAIALCVAGAGCDIDITAVDMIGAWGGEHILLTVSSTGSMVEYDCAHGTIEGSIVPDRDGTFTLPGIHVREHGGPVREDEVPDEHPARYWGWTDGSRMRLTVTLTDTGETRGPYELRLGRAPELFKCL